MAESRTTREILQSLNVQIFTVYPDWQGIETSAS